KFVSSCSDLEYELRNRRTLAKLLSLVWLWFRSPHVGLAARMMRTSEPPHWRCLCPAPRHPRQTSGAVPFSRKSSPQDSHQSSDLTDPVRQHLTTPAAGSIAARARAAVAAPYLEG